MRGWGCSADKYNKSQGTIATEQVSRFTWIGKANPPVELIAREKLQADTVMPSQKLDGGDREVQITNTTAGKLWNCFSK